MDFDANKINSAALTIVRRLVKAGYEAYIVGGAVRDLLLHREPKDYDIATSATPEEVQAVFGRRQCLIIGRRFRLAQVRMGEDEYEVSTFRRAPSLEERKGRYDDDTDMIWNDNVYGSLEDDVHRRDFTVNALYYDPCTGRGIIDMVGGIADIATKTVRVIGDARTRFAEDPVRMLRALKLVGIHGFTLEADTDAALREKRGMIQLSSISRLYEELIKILMTGRSQVILDVCHKYGFLGCFWEFLDSFWDTREGHIMQRLMLARDHAIRRGRYSNSKALALSAMCLPYVMKHLPDVAENSTEDSDWTHGAGVPSRCLQLIHEFFGNFVVPRYYTLRVKEIVLMIPPLSDSAIAGRYYHNKEYRYGRLLMGLLVDGLGWEPELFEQLPDPAEVGELPAHKSRRRRRSRHKKSAAPASVETTL